MLVVGMFAAGTDGNASAQTQAPTGPHAERVIRLRHRMDSLAPIIKELDRENEARVDSAQRREAARTRLEWDSVQIGPFQLIGEKREVESKARYFADAWDRMSPLFSGMEADIDGVVFVIARVQAQRWIQLPRHYHTPFYSGDEAAALQRTADRALGIVLTRRLPPSVRAWLAPEGIGGATDLHVVRQRLAYSVTPRVPRSPRTLPAQRRPDTTNRCAHYVMADCRNLLALVGPTNESAIPYLRAAFINHVIAQAPQGALAASSTDGSSAIEAIERLGGAPLDTLMKTWLDSVYATRSGGFAGVARLNLITIFWVIVFAAIAMRSTRWRLG